MKKLFELLLSVVISVVFSNLLFAQGIPSDSLYLGQTPPGNIPKIFNLPVTGGLRPIERIAISSDGKEIYFGLLNTYPPSVQRTKCYKYFNDRWQGPFDVFENHASPRLTVNDSTMYIQTNINDFSTTYRSIKISSGWSTPKKLLNTTQQTHYFQTTALNNSYVSSNLPNTPAQRDICKLVINGTDTLIQSLGLPISTASDENDLFVSDDESYLLFSRNNSGGGDIFLSYKKSDGKWTNPKNLGEPINKPGNSWEYGMFVSKDGMYLFYTSGGTTMSSYYTYWIKIDNIIDSLRYTNFAPYLYNQIPNQTDSVGYEFNYTFSDSTFIDDDGNNSLTYSATLSNGNPLPSWLSFDPSARLFYGTPTTVGNILIKVTATDNANAKAFCTFSLKIEDTSTDITDDEQSLNDYKLYQNYPNPFNPSTKISWQSSVSSWQSLKVYDALGNEVAILVNEYKPAGRYEVEFDARNFSSGIYFYILKTNTFCDRKKMIVLK
ncbi:MAG TPA: putative Ig domain-containing protein [Ignavibacteriaceae bacterium]|jgi:hypothetical protein|nr:MAG: putative Ig domain protein [Ignavibacteria bacterium ADurb.Bin266]OQY69586.1 MAG: hypothetical protein B6D44_17515 [Ignavibacteriales bacterium UTCHB2]HQF41388.1 putative Ig domain-containing protein [Ignavibacteriaceae bacterium]HQI40515.1 putative Ig domain-containing protein [Ignavibacteriaceae bacterium]